MPQVQLPTPPTPPAAPVIAGPISAGNAATYYTAVRAQRHELSNQMEQLQDRRGELTQRIREAPSGADQKGLEQQLADLDARISTLDKQIADADAAVARAAGIPGAIQPDPPPIPDRGPPDSVVAITIVFILAVLMPLALAYARRLWKRAAAAPMQVPQELSERLARLESAVGTVAEEVERIGEGQRFVTKLFAEPAARPLAAAAEARATEPVRQASR